MQSKGTFQKTVESAEYDFVREQAHLAEIARLKQVLQDQVDYHHYIGNSDCPVTANEAFIHLYNSAKNALN